MKLERLGRDPLDLGTTFAAAEQIAIAELHALGAIDDVVRPEELDATSFAARDFDQGQAISELQLAAPPVRAPAGDALFRSLSSFIDTLSARDGGASIEERRMGALLKGIHGLEVEIRSLMSRTVRV